MDSRKIITIGYRFEIESNRAIQFDVHLDSETTQFVDPKPSTPPAWTKLCNHQCENCPLNEKDTPHCPVAVNLHKLAESFKNEKSYVQTKVTVSTSQRDYCKSVPLQTGLGSLFGLIMATSGCPVLDFLKPMARYHLPFSTLEETLIRVTSIFLLSEFVNSSKPPKPEMDLEKLDKHYAEVKKVNKGISARIQALHGSGDADSNALVILDSFGILLSHEIKNNLNAISQVFKVKRAA